MARRRLQQIKAGFSDVAQAFDMPGNYDTREPMRVLLMVSKFDHCLTDLLYRYHKGEMDMTITAIVSNHLDLRPMAEREGIRFIYLPVTKDTKARRKPS
jgi:formyltetrahydrofolate deformylase